jgi:hypothetical protein
VVTRGRGDPRLVTVEREREQHLQCLGLSCSVGTAQQQAAVGEDELLLVVLPDIENAGTVQPEPAGPVAR